MSEIRFALTEVLRKIDVAFKKRQNNYENKKPRLVAVSKMKPKSMIIEAYKLGQRNFGENYVQELLEKSLDDEILEKCPNIMWHFIGHLQKNKLSKILQVPNLYIIETIDSVELATILNSRLHSLRKNPLKVFVQVNISEENTKHGCKIEETFELINYILRSCPYLIFCGMMTIGSIINNNKRPNQDFLKLSEYKKQICSQFDLELDNVELSMGMSNDFEEAVKKNPHLGHLHSVVLADAKVRFQCLNNELPMIFSCGTDEHGIKVEQAAKKKDKDILQYCDNLSLKFKQLFSCFDIGYSDYVRTTEQRHLIAVKKFWSQLIKNNHIYKSLYSGWYCIQQECFISSLDIAYDSALHQWKTKDLGHSVEWLEEENYMFKLKNFQPDLIHWARKKQPIYPKIFQKQLESWLQESTLDDISVSRPTYRLQWGIQVPDDKCQIIYVWLDALISYLTVVGYPNNLSIWPPTWQVIGKDILKFHGIYWPAFLMAAGLEPPHCIVCHSHWTVGKKKMSKSLSNVIDPVLISKDYTKDGIRYFLLRSATLHSDADFSEEKVLNLLNAELADTLGNFVNRCTVPVVNKYQIFPNFPLSLSCNELILLENLHNLPCLVGKYFDQFLFYHGLELIMDVIRKGHKYFQEQRPWEIQINEQVDKLERILYVSLEILRVSAILLQPVIPVLSNIILDKLSISKSKRLWSDAKDFSVNSAHGLQQGNICLFSRINFKNNKN